MLVLRSLPLKLFKHLFGLLLVPPFEFALPVVNELIINVFNILNNFSLFLVLKRLKHGLSIICTHFIAGKVHNQQPQVVDRERAVEGWQ